MAKKKNKKLNKKKSVAKTTASPSSTAGDLAATLAKTEKAATALATGDDAEAPELPAMSPEQEAVAKDTITRAEKLLEKLQRMETEATKRSRQLDEREGMIEDDRTTLYTLKDELGQCEQALAERDEKLKENEADILKRHEEIARRELDADAGFSRRNRESLARLEAEGEALRKQQSRHREQLEEERARFEQEMRKKQKELDQRADADRESAAKELASLREDLEKQRKQLDDKEKELRVRQRDIDGDREILKEDQEALREKVAKYAAREIETKNNEIKALTEQLDVARKGRDQLERTLAEREEADRRFGGETPEDVLKRLTALEKERNKLKKQLGSRPSPKAVQRLEELEREKGSWESNELEIRSELAAARQDASRKRIAVTELESLRDEKRALESANALLHEILSQLRTEVDTLIKSAEGKSPFPSCSAMDSSTELQSSRRTTDTIRSLADFADYVRNRMARAPQTGKELYYSEEDVRSFIGGLAMSRLHLLQGISGTGKTSLPLAFARAIGAKTALIEVQAGWRDRQDLIGHFNTFERRFSESEFLQALYKASTPRYQDTPFIIVLDEMNLSHPEQYFADLLSALEQDRERQRLVLMTAPVESAPNLLRDGGRKIQIPPNVWFVGTANHDETTRDFADKTYDRAHVMELPSTHEQFTPEDKHPIHPVSWKALENAFEDSAKDHRKKAAKAYEFLQTNLGDILERRFRLGWGNRLERQMGAYVPVVIEAGGTIGEATDHILATKLLRKIRDRHDNRPEYITELRERIETGWTLLDKKHKPLRSLEMLRQELRRLGQDNE